MAKINRDHPPQVSDDLIVKTFSDLEKTSWALYSSDMTYRYRLRRYWAEGGRLAFLMLNPSTATELKNDPTVERCERRARALGFGGFEVVNIFALRSTDPKGLYQHDDPIGKFNNKAILTAIDVCDAVLCAWGNHGSLNARGNDMRDLLKTTGKPLMQLGITKADQPTHPLYISYNVSPEAWDL